MQATDAYVATQNARVVLVDDMMVRALMTASWLEQLGWCDAYVLESGLEGQAILRGGREAPTYGLAGCEVTSIHAAEARSRLAEGAILIDLQRSLGYREKHAEGARFAIRARLDRDLEANGIVGQVILTSPDGRLATLAAIDLISIGKDAVVLAGGTDSWEECGFPIEAGMTNVLSPTDDVYLRAYDRTEPAEIEKAMIDYLTWEIALVDQFSKPGVIMFKTYPA